MENLTETKFDRFYTDEDLYKKYKELKEDDKVLFDYHPKLFLLSAVIGYKYDLNEELENPKQLVQKSAVFNNEDAEIIYNAFKMITYKKEKRDEDGLLKVKETIEEYAKGGFKKIYKEIFLRKNESKTKDLIDYIMIHY